MGSLFLYWLADISGPIMNHYPLEENAMPRKPYSVRTHTHTHVKAKNLRKNDNVAAFGYALVVVSNSKNDMNGRVLKLKTRFGPKRQFEVIIGKNVPVDVTDSQSKYFPKNR
jgi:hypothetical protein